MARRIDASCVVVQVRRQPGIAAWCLLWVLLLPQLRVWRGPPEPMPPRPSEQEAWLRDRAEDAVHRVLRAIGHNVTIDEVNVRSLEPMVTARYRSRDRRIEISSDQLFSKDELLETMGHECVHAIFDQSGLNYGGSRGTRAFRLLINETSAYVLGAHIAGIVRTREGGNGRALTEKLVRAYRASCDPTNPDSMHQFIAASHGTDRELDPDRELQISFHFGSPELVDQIDVICREHPDPWDAAFTIAKTYFCYDGEEPGGSFWWLPEHGGRN